MDSVILSVVQFLPLVFVAFVAVMLVARHFANKAKSERFQRLAQSLGLDYRPTLDTGSVGFFEDLFNQYQQTTAFVAKYEGFAPMGKPQDRVRFLFSGSWHGMESEVFEYRYTTGSGKNRSTHYYSVASLVLPSTLPAMTVSPETMFDKIGKFFGGQDVQFESEEFNQSFRVIGTDERAVHAVLHPQMMEWFLSRNPPSFQCGINRVVVYRYGVLKDEFVTGSLTQMAEFWELVPAFVKEGGI